MVTEFEKEGVLAKMGVEILMMMGLFKILILEPNTKIYNMIKLYRTPCTHGLPSGSVVKHLPVVPGSGRSPGGGHGNPLQYSCLENPRDWGAWQATVQSVAKSQMTKATEHARVHTHTHKSAS